MTKYLQQIGLLTTTLVIALVQLVTPVFAAEGINTPLTGNDYDALRRNTEFVDTSQPCGTSASNAESDASSVEITGDNVKDSYFFFTSNGFTKEQAAGIVGNLMFESGYSKTIDPTNYADNGDGGYGIAQFTPPTDMRAWTKAHDLDSDSLDGQLKYMLHVLTDGWRKAAGAALKKTTTVDEATLVFEMKYEVPKSPGPSLKFRQANANKAFDLYSGEAPGSGNAAATAQGENGCSSGGTASCTATPTASAGSDAVDSTSATPSTTGSTATGNAKILCEAEKYAGIYYRWAGGHNIDSFIKACPDPSKPEPNKPHGAASDSSNGGVSGNPSPCATDCSGLVIVAVYYAFGAKLSGNVQGLVTNTSNFKKINIADVQAGDVVIRQPAFEHIEIVDHYAGNGKVATFGSHRTGTKTGPLTTGGYDGAYRYIGKGAGSVNL